MKLSISNIAWSKEQDAEVYQVMKQLGFTGLEIAPTRIFPDKPYGHIDEAIIWKKNLYVEYGFTISSMQSIWFGRNENIFENEESKNALIEYTKKAIDFASNIGCKNLVFGCPKNRKIPENMDIDYYQEIAYQFFRSISEYAYSKNTTIAMEANPKIYNTNFINTTIEAINLIEKVNSKGFKLNLDLGTIIENNETIEILNEKLHLINHVHISEPFLKIIQKRNLHKQLKELLDNVNYKNFISIEVAQQDNVNLLLDIMKYICEVFK